MPEFQYVARELNGTQVNGVMTAGSEHEVLSSLAARSLFPVRVDAAVTSGTSKVWGGRIKNQHLATTYSQLSDLLRSGVPLVRSLEILQTQSTSAALSTVLAEVRAEVMDGTPIAQAMSAHPRVFSELTRSMVRAGEEGGFLEDVLKRIAAFTEHQEEMRSRVLGAVAYPAFLAVMAAIIVTVIIVFFVPNFEPLFARLEARGELPWATTALLGFSSFLGSYGLWALGGLIGIVLWCVRVLRTERGRLWFDGWQLRVKGVGPIIRSLAISRFCRILGTLLHNGVPILRSLQIAKDATGNLLLSRAINHAAENITAGKTLAQPLKISGQFPVEVVEMITVGEEANNLEQVLIDIADNVERRTNRQLDLFVRLLEPLMLLVMAIVILFIVIALLWPVLQSSRAIG